MPYRLDDAQYEAVLARPAEVRYEHFVKRCADWGEVWGLKRGEGDWAVTQGTDGGAALAVWPHPRYAQACAVGEWDDRDPAPIDLEAFVDDVIPDLIADGLDVVVFPRPDGLARPVSPRRLRSDLEAAMTEIG